MKERILFGCGLLVLAALIGGSALVLWAGILRMLP